jgi:hypothetical protein
LSNIAGLEIPDTLHGYVTLWKWICSLKDDNRMQEWEQVMRHYVLKDMFFFLNFVSSDGKTIHSHYQKPFYFHEFYLDFCKKVQYYIDNLKSSEDASARRGGKSTIRTKLGSIQMALRYPNISISVFSVQKQLAKKHVSVIKEELQSNTLLKKLFPDILYDDPQLAAKNGETIWSLTEGLRVKRDRVRSTQTIEHGAFFGGGPVGSGYDVIHFDDCENESVVSTSDMLSKLHESYSSAVNLATPAVLPYPVFFITNTFYHPEGIAYKKYKEYKAIDENLVRVVPGEDLSVPGDGPMGGTPMYPFTRDILQMKFTESNKDNYAIQYCCDFKVGHDRSFRRDWLQFYDGEPRDMMRGKNSYICIDASRGVYDPMGIMVWSVGQDKKLYWTDGRRKKLDPASPSFFDEIFNIVATTHNFSDRLVEIRVEQMHQQTWAELINAEMNKRGIYIKVVPCRGKLETGVTRKFATTKLDREWQRWAPVLQRGEIMFPRPTSLGGRGIMTQDESGKPFDLVDYFLSFEYDLFPRAPNDDILDAGDLIWDPDGDPIQYPSVGYKRTHLQGKTTSLYSWMSAG